MSSKSHLLFENFLVAPSQVTLSATGGSTASSAALLGDVQPLNAGSAALERQAPVGYTSLIDRIYVIEIESTTDGTFANTRYRWSDSGGITWNASDLTPSAGVWVALSHGIEIRFVAGAEPPQFYARDRWSVAVTLPYGPAKLMDGTRDQEWRSGAVAAGGTISFGIDLGSMKTPEVLAILDHDFALGGTYALQSSNVSMFGALSNHVPLAMTAGRFLSFLSVVASRYWWLALTNAASPLDYFRMSTLYLGATRQLVKGFTASSVQRANRRVGSVDLDALTRGPAVARYRSDVWRGTFSRVKHGTGQVLGDLTDLLNATEDLATVTQHPFLFLPNEDVPSDFSLYAWANDYERDLQFFDRWNAPVEFVEVMRTRAD